MSPRVPQAYLEARRTEIVSAAFQCFVQKGFQNTTMQDIYDATGLSPGAVYNYFNSKEDIVVAALRNYAEATLGSLGALVRENPDESFVKYFQYLFSSVVHDEVPRSFSASLEFYAEASRNGKIRDTLVHSMHATGDALREPVRQKQRAGLYNTQLDPVSIAHVMVGMVFAAAVHKMVEPDFDLKNYGRVCEAMLKGTFCRRPRRRANVKE